MIAAKPQLKPTTAIKALGVTDPSAIRRLRDKFHAFSSDVSVEPTASVASVPRTTPRVVAAAVAEDAACIREVPATTTLQNHVSNVAGCIDAAAPRFPTPFDIFAMWCGLGISALSTALATQAAVSRNLSRLPHVDAALRHQLALNELAMAIVPGRPAARTTLH